jgi:hypothetical protein
MKNFFVVILMLLSSCINSLPRADVEENNRKAMYKTIVQICIDSLYRRKYPKEVISKYNYQLHNVIMAKNKHLGEEQSFHWGKELIAYKIASKNLEKAYWHSEPTGKVPYLLKIDSISVNEPGQAFVRILCVGQRSLCEYKLSLKGDKWHIDQENTVDYEVGPGPTNN